MKRFVLARPVERDLDAIETYLNERASPEIARRAIPVQVIRVLHGKRDIEAIMN